MLGDVERRYTVDNNVTGTHNICSAIVEVNPNIHIVHLGTMGVYGYNKRFGAIPEGYLEVQIKETALDTEILYPANPGSVYHLTKCLDQLVFQFYNKNWGLKITDLHQGIVWGVETEQTIKDPELVNRFDYDGIYGTVLNRFISQAANDFPLTVYGSGGQSRAFIHVSDTARCIGLALENSDFDSSRVRIFNQVAEVFSVKGLADILQEQYGASVNYLENPRKELAENELEVSNTGLVSLGFEPIRLSEGLVQDVKFIAEATRENFEAVNVNTSPKW
jgi:UDP-sulfoquinovose synthase